MERMKKEVDRVFSEEENRREEIARDALNTGMGQEEDPYWLCNLFGRCKHGSLLRQAKELREDADVLEAAFEKIDSEELTPAEAALYIAERVNQGEYEIFDNSYDNLPIEVDVSR